MTEREKLIAFLSNVDEPDGGGATVFEVAAMLSEVVDEYQHRPQATLGHASA